MSESLCVYTRMHAWDFVPHHLPGNPMHALLDCWLCLFMSYVSCPELTMIISIYSKNHLLHTIAIAS